MRALSVTTLVPSSSTGTWMYPPVSATSSRLSRYGTSTTSKREPLELEALAHTLATYRLYRNE